MEVVFITIHDLSLDARVKYCSNSVEDILGYKPNEVKGKSCWEYFHPDEIPFARAIHGRGLDLDKAAALNYCRIKHKDGRWIGCECVFTVVYDVLVASTAIYQRGPKAQRKAVEGAAVRRIFSSSPRDPRYHMLSYISSKFTQSFIPETREPRAALILNRFTRNSTIMYATGGVEKILGFAPMELVGKSFYYCVAENCLSQAVRTMESAKGNDSIAYLRFYFRDPTLPDPPQIEHGDSDSESDDGGVRIVSRHASVDRMSTSPVLNSAQIPEKAMLSPEPNGVHAIDKNDDNRKVFHETPSDPNTRTSSEDSAQANGTKPNEIFDPPLRPSGSSPLSITPQTTPSHSNSGVIEVEAVVSCTSDGLVVVLRRAHPMVPEAATQTQPQFPDGLFASPWADEPIIPPGLQHTTSVPDIAYPALAEPVESGFMSAIRDVAVFAWSLTGINGHIIDNAIGTPTGEAIPPGGLPIWDPNAPVGQNDGYNGFSGSNRRPLPGMGDPARDTTDEDTELTSSDDEIVWKRVPQIPAFQRPKRRAHDDAFGSDSDQGLSNGHASYEQPSRRRKLENGDISTTS